MPSVSALRSHLSINFFQLFFQFGNTLLYDTAVNLNLGFTHTSSRTHTTSLSFKVSPHARESRQHIIVPGQFHLHLRIGSLRSLCEDFQNKAGSVNDTASFDYLLDISLLCTRQFVIENDVFYLIFLAIFSYFLKFSASYICSIIRPFQSLDKFLVSGSPCCLSEEFELVKVFHYLAFFVLVSDDSYEYSFFYVLCHTFLRKKGHPVWGQP